MRISFQCETGSEPDVQMFETTLVSEVTSKPLFCALAARSLDGEYHLSGMLSDDVAKDLDRFEVIHRIPFRLILGSLANLT